jgi:hypothetical protein
MIGYYLLPEGFMRGSLPTVPARLANNTHTFRSGFALTLLFNLGVVVISLFANLFQKKGLPVGCIVPVSLGIVSGLTSGTNSFVASDLKQYNAWDGAALAMSVRGLEMMSYMLIISSTISFGVYQSTRWVQGKYTKVMNLSDVRLSKSEIICLVSGIVLLIVAAYRETAMNL